MPSNAQNTTKLLLKRILIVDDEIEHVEALATILAEMSREIQKAASVMEAAQRLRNQVFDCILLDLKLGNGSGLDVLKQMRADRSSLNAKSPVLIISGHLDKAAVQAAGPHVIGFLVKPVTKEMVLAKLRAQFQT
ncbi:MAG: response regulator [Bdellovibrionota bacterium]